MRVTSGPGVSRQDPTVALSPSGKMAAAWVSFEQTVGGGYDVVLRCYTAQGEAAGDEAVATTATEGNQVAPSLAAFRDGSSRFVLVWQSQSIATGYDVFGQVLLPDGTPVGDAFPVNSTTEGDQVDPAVAVADDATLAVAWRSGPSAGAAELHVRRFDAKGAPLGDELTLSGAAADLTHPSITSLPTGELAVVWQSLGQDEDGAAIRSARFDAGGKIGLDWLANTTFAGNQTAPRIATGPKGIPWAVWTGNGGGGIVGRPLD